MTILDVNLGQDHLTAGDSVTFEATVKNIGATVTDDIVGVGFWLDRQFFTFGTSHPLESGGVQHIKAVSSWQAVAGRHKLTAIVDDINRFPEQSEINNIFELDVQVFDSIEG